MSSYRCMLRPTWMISALQHKSKYKSNSISNFFEKKNQIFWFPCCSTREHLSVDISITYVGLILTKPGRFFFSEYGNSMYGQNSISNFLKKFTFLGFHGVAKVISALRQKSKFEFRTFLKKKIKFLGFHGVVLVKTFPLMYQLLM